MMIEDEELRSLYQTTCKGRLHVLKSGLLPMATDPAGDLDDRQLEALRREVHSLKGDSRVMGLEAIADIAQAVEKVVKGLQLQPPKFALKDDTLQRCLQAALVSMEQRIEAATAAQESPLAHFPIEVGQIVSQLEAAMLEASHATGDTGADESSPVDPSTADPSTADVDAEPVSPALTSTFIADADIRTLYRTTSERRLQAMNQALEQLVNNAQDASALAAFRHESQGLRGDSSEVGQGAIAAMTQQFEAISNRLISRGLEFTQPLQDHLWQGLQIVSQLIHEAISTDISQPVTTEALHFISIELATYLTPGIAQEMPELSDTLLSPIELIEDEELREIYKTTSEQRLAQLETSLSQLGADPRELTPIADMLHEVHSLKGDARSTQVTPVADLAEAVETVLKRFQSAEMTISPEVFDSLRQSIWAMGALVQTATVGTPNSINVVQLTQNLQELASLAPPVLDGLSGENSQDAPLSVAQSAAPSSATSQASQLAAAPSEAGSSAPAPAVSQIEDEELREVYRAVSAERLQRLERGLAQLSAQPDDSAVMAELLREAHSLKGDARSVGLDDVEQLSHAIEDILIGIQQQPTILTVELGDLLLRGMDVIARLMDEAITGRPSTLTDATSLVQELRAVALPAPEVTEAAKLSAAAISEFSALTAEGFSELLSVPKLLSAPELLPAPNPQSATAPTVTPFPSPEPVATSPSAAAAADANRIETIRVQTRDLDALAAQAEQLTLTRIQTAQTTAKMTELVDLWGKWRTHQRQNQSSQNQANNPYEASIDTLINRLRLATQENSFRLDLISQDFSQQVQTLRLLPVSTVLRGFPRVVRELARKQSKSVELITEGEETTADKRILEDIQDSLMQLVRNAIDHGIETPEEREAAGKPPTATLRLRSYQSPNSLVVEVSDDGRGLDLEQIKQTAIRRKLYSSEELDKLFPSQLQELIFVPGFSTRSFTTEISGRGVGLDVVRNQVERLKGNVQIESTPGQGCTFRLQLRTQLATANVVLVSVRGVIHALPIEFLQTTMRLSANDITTAEGKDTIEWNEQTIPVRELFDVLELAQSPAYTPPAERVPGSQRACLLLKSGGEMGAFLVDRLLDTQEVVFKPQSAVLKRIRNVVGLTILGNGDICNILNPADLVKSIQRMEEGPAIPLRESPSLQKPLILLVEDSPPVRIQEKRLFENAGYEVVTAEDGLDGYNILREGRFDAVISDIEMPNLDGLSLTRKIREHEEYEELPIILVTTLSSDQDRQKGADMGANAYIVKGKFNQEVLLETLQRLI